MTENLISLSDVKPGHVFRWDNHQSLFLRVDGMWSINISTWKSIYIDLLSKVEDLGKISEVKYE